MPSDAPESIAPASAIRIPDAHTRAVVESERQRRQDKTTAATARAMILERAAQLAQERQGGGTATPARLAHRTPDPLQATT